MKILFIYNSKSSIQDRIFDYAHKIISPKTYSCNLCKLTHHNLGEQKSWKKFIENSKHQFIFYHKDEFELKQKKKLNTQLY